jgi:hypothetical protein
MNKMVEHAINLERQYQNIRNFWCDGAVPIYWQNLARLYNQRLDFEQNVKELKSWRYDDASILRRLKVQPVMFQQKGRQMMAALKWFMDTNTIQIHPIFKDLIIGLKSIQAIEFDYLKDDSVNPDLVDVLRMSLLMVKPRQPIPAYVPIDSNNVIGSGGAK